MEPRRLRALLLVAVLLGLSLPAAASTDGVAIVASSVPAATVDVDETGNVTIDLAAEGSGGVVQIVFHISNAEGNIVWNQSSTVQLGPGETGIVSVDLSQVPHGSHTVVVTLSGDVLPNNATHASNASFTVQRDRPLNISIVASNSDRVEALDDQGLPSGRDARHGDKVAWFVTLRNQGDVAWAGNLTATFEQGSQNESVEMNVNVNGTSDVQVVLVTTASWEEGAVLLNASLLDVDDGHPLDDRLEWTALIGAPPLPSLNMSLERLSTPEAPGETMSHRLWVNNTGEAEFNGTLECLWGDGQAYAAILQASITAGNGTVFHLTGTARDGVLMCSAQGVRLEAGSQQSVSDTLSMPSARFELVAGGAPLALNGPWDVGDDVTWSAVVRNVGDREGEVSLRLSSDNLNHSSAPTRLAPGGAAELRVSFPLEREGYALWAWSIDSPDGTVLSEGGSTPVDVHAAPSLHLEVGALVLGSDGIVVPWSVNVTSSRAREALLEVGHGAPGAWMWSTAIPLTLDNGWIEGEASLGWPSSERIAVRISPVGWAHEAGPLLLSATLESTSPSLSLQIQRQVQPTDPAPGAAATVTVSLSNSGDKQSVEGSIHLIAGRGSILASDTLPSLAPGEQRDLRFTIEWPAGATVEMTAYAWSEHGLVLDQLTFELATVDEGASLTIPWTSVALGASGGVVLLLVESIRRRSPSTPRDASASGASTAPNPPPSSRASQHEEKVEVACPACARSLRVPATYSGAVRCPDCKERFDVETPTSDDNEASASAPDVEVEEAPKKVDIACPACAQTLRVPTSFNGRVRCPACREEFQRTEAA
jgi:uncharacterized CHY-type Zn-finger protein